jgi:hypothetical protein
MSTKILVVKIKEALNSFTLKYSKKLLTVALLRDYWNFFPVKFSCVSRRNRTSDEVLLLVSLFTRTDAALVFPPF